MCIIIKSLLDNRNVKYIFVKKNLRNNINHTLFSTLFIKNMKFNELNYKCLFRFKKMNKNLHINRQ